MIFKQYLPIRFFLTYFFVFFSFFFISKSIIYAVFPGDANGDNRIDGLDYVIWLQHYGEITSLGEQVGDFNDDNNVDGLDYVLWLNNYGKIIPTSFPTVSNTPPTSISGGIWISPEEIMSLPTSGEAWNRVLSAANSNWGSANLGDNNSDHDVNTLAGALIAARLNDTSMRNKTIAGLQSAMNSDLSRALELSRGLQAYVIAADIIGYRTPQFETWVRTMLDVDITPHTGGSTLCNSSGVAESCNNLGGVVCTAIRSPNNWGGMARSAAIASARYLGDTVLLQRLANAHRAFVGESVTNSLYCQNTNWHASSTEKFGVNRKNATIQGQDVSGVLPEDWRRAEEFKWPPTFSGYMWEGMQGYVVSAVMLYRAGLVPLTAGDNAVVRSMDMLYKINYPPGSDDSWMPWVVNKYWGTNYSESSTSPGKGMGYTDWTHQ